MPARTTSRGRSAPGAAGAAAGSRRRAIRRRDAWFIGGSGRRVYPECTPDTGWVVAALGVGRRERGPGGATYRGVGSPPRRNDPVTITGTPGRRRCDEPRRRL